MFILKLVQLLDVLFLHSIDLFNLFIVFEFLPPFTLRNFIVKFVNQSVIEFLRFFV